MSNTMTAEESNQTLITINDLIIGRTTSFPIYDPTGVLLLAQGSVITSEIKKNLRSRGASKILIHDDDLSRITARKANTNIGATPAFSFDNEITNRLDAVIDSGLLTVKNTGPAVKNDVVFLGRKAYDQEQRDKLVQQHEKNGEALGDMISEALHGKNADGSIVAAMAANYLQEMCTDIDNTLSSTINQFSSDDLAARSLEVSLLAMAIGIEMDLDGDCIKEIGVSGLVHDWGMMKVPVDLLRADRKLTDVERLEIKKHPIHSLEMRQHVSSLPRVCSIVAYQVHECYNGTGYPRGRNGNSIHIYARILKVADAYCALTMSRPFRPAFTRYSAMECLIRQAKKRSVDPNVVRALLKIISLFPIGSYIALSDGSVAKVLRRNKDHYTKPIVLRVLDQQGHDADPDLDENLIDLNDTDLTVIQALPAPGTEEIMLTDDALDSAFS